MKLKLKIVTVLIWAFLWTVSVYSQTATVIVENANLRGTPSQSGKVVVILENSSSVEIIKQSGAWYLVQTSDYVVWVHGNTIRLEVNSDSSLANSGGSITPIQKKKSIKSNSTSKTSASSRRYYLGPRGGCYYLTAGGNKVYVDRSLCR